MQCAHDPLYDTHPAIGVSIEVFYADRTLETFGRGGAGWFWRPRRGQFTGWLAYWAVCYELRNVPTRAAKSWFERAAV